MICSLREGRWLPTVVIQCYCELKSLRWYKRTRPRLFPMATYSLRAEKSTLVTCPSGVLEVGQLEKAVSVGRWTYVRR